MLLRLSASLTALCLLSCAGENGSSQTSQSPSSGGTLASGGTDGGVGTGPSGGSGANDSGGQMNGMNGSGGSTPTDGPDPNFHVFLLIGQSNMAGDPAPEQQDRMEHPRVKVLAYDNCPNLGRTYNEWYPASPPLHDCYFGVGPGDAFGKAMADALPDATIGLVPCAIPGVDIDFFRKGVVSTRRGEFSIPPDDHWSGAYEWVIERARLAQQSGVIRGILFHQGESNTNQASWVGQVKEMVEDLRADLELGDVPFIAGELLQSGCCASHNTYVNQLPSQISNTRVVSSSGLSGSDMAHFDLASQRIFGQRYADALLEVWQP